MRGEGTGKRIFHCKDCAHQIVVNPNKPRESRYICSSERANKSNTGWLIHGRQADFLDCDQARAINGSCASSGNHWKKKD